MFNKITSKEVLGLIYKALETNAGLSWVGPLSLESTSDSSTERYAWLGQVPTLREWKGPRMAKQLLEFDYSIKNKEFEATLEVAVRDLSRDKTGQLEKRIAEFAKRPESHWASLITELIENGETNLCYDGKAFFSATHTEGESGTQKNLLTATEVPSLNVGTATAPTTAEMASAIFDVISYMRSYKDDVNEPLNEDGSKFIVMCGHPSIYNAAAKAISQNIVVNAGAATDNILKNVSLEIAAVQNPRLVASAWDTKFCVFRADAPVQPFIRQSEGELDASALAEGSDYEFLNKAHLYGLNVSRAAGYGFWQYATKATLS
jgi:phage major head subunit gpT-like protein